jgi:FKBP-type peptidyl-prolyl cis-trans isomerase FklB
MIPLRWVVVVMTLASMMMTMTTLVSAGTNAEGKAYLEENAKKPDVVTLPSGLQYRVLKEGTGQYHPVKDSQCLCHYHGTLIDGTTFDSSYDRDEPTTFAPNQVIKGWTEAMQMMVEGDVWELTIPSELAYGDSGSPPKIPGGSVLIFKIEIIKIKHDISFLVPASKCNVATKEKCTEQDITYIEKVTSGQWSIEKMQKERERLESMSRSKVKPELKSWIQRRIVLLREMEKQLINADSASTTSSSSAATSDNQEDSVKAEL